MHFPALFASQLSSLFNGNSYNGWQECRIIKTDVSNRPAQFKLVGLKCNQWSVPNYVDNFPIVHQISVYNEISHHFVDVYKSDHRGRRNGTSWLPSWASEKQLYISFNFFDQEALLIYVTPSESISYILIYTVLLTCAGDFCVAWK